MEMEIDKVIESKHLKPPPRIEFHHVNHLSNRCMFVLENSKIMFFPNNLNTSQPNDMKAQTNIFSKIMSTTELKSVHTNVRGKNTRDL